MTLLLIAALFALLFVKAYYHVLWHRQLTEVTDFNKFLSQSTVEKSTDGFYHLEHPFFGKRNLLFVAVPRAVGLDSYFWKDENGKPLFVSYVKVGLAGFRPSSVRIGEKSFTADIEFRYGEGYGLEDTHSSPKDFEGLARYLDGKMRAGRVVEIIGKLCSIRWTGALTTFTICIDLLDGRAPQNYR